MVGEAARSRTRWSSDCHDVMAHVSATRVRRWPCREGATLVSEENRGQMIDARDRCASEVRCDGDDLALGQSFDVCALTGQTVSGRGRPRNVFYSSTSEPTF